MFASIACPACHHKFTIPEGAMGSRHTCPNCHSPFRAGKSVTDGDAPIPMKFEPVAAAGINKTMLGETAPPITYNCPRCKKVLESPASEALTKKPCPACGQRLQVPAAPPPTAPQPNLNKTILAADERTTLATGVKADHAPLPPAAAPPPAAIVPPPAPPAPSGISTRTLAIGGGAVAALVLLVLLTCVVSAMLTGPKTDNAALLAAQKELEDLKRSIKQKEDLVAHQKEAELKLQAKWDKMLADQKAERDQLEYKRQLDMQLYQNNKDKLAEANAKRQQEQDEIDRKAKADQAQRDKAELEVKAKLAELQTQLNAANQRATTIIQAPPPPVYYPWHPRYYYPW